MRPERRAALVWLCALSLCLAVAARAEDGRAPDVAERVAAIDEAAMAELILAHWQRMDCAVFLFSPPGSVEAAFLETVATELDLHPDDVAALGWPAVEVQYLAAFATMLDRFVLDREGAVIRLQDCTP